MGKFELKVIEVQNPRSELKSGACCASGLSSSNSDLTQSEDFENIDGRRNFRTIPSAIHPSSSSYTDTVCETQCQTVVSLCLKEYQSASPEKNPDIVSGTGCTYGMDTTSVLGPSSFTLSQPPDNGHIQLPFTFSWTVSTYFFFLKV